MAPDYDAAFPENLGHTIGQRIELRSPLEFALPRSLAQIAGKAVDCVQNEYAARFAGGACLYGNQPVIRRSA